MLSSWSWRALPPAVSSAASFSVRVLALLLFVVTGMVAALASGTEFPVAAAIAPAAFAQLFFVHAGSAQFPAINALPSGTEFPVAAAIAPATFAQLFFV